MNNKCGSQTIKFKNEPSILSTAAVVGPEEGKGPLGNHFDIVVEDLLLGKESWEKAESEFVSQATDLAIKKSGLKNDDLDVVFAGDLLNQCIAATYGLREKNIPFLGLYGACSTFVEGAVLSSILVDGGFATNAMCVASSHFASAERQFRAPLDLGNQRAPGTQRTISGSGAMIISANAPKDALKIKYATIGKIIDLGITDVNNMGACMAPAAADTIVAFLKDTGINIEKIDRIITGDLGEVGSKLCKELIENEGFDLKDKYVDCGDIIFQKSQDAHAGGSGCGCVATVFSSHFYKLLKEGVFNNCLLLATGALFSPTSSFQGESIPGIAHAIFIEGDK